MLLTDLAAIAAKAQQKEAENSRFKEQLKQSDDEVVDRLVAGLNAIITPQIDCTQCGNCCRTLMINVDATDAKRLAGHLQLSEATFYERYIERSSEGALAVMNKIPCHFLQENKCTVYEARPAECREFPGLHHPGFTKRLFTIFMHYDRCPIIYNVVEALKNKLQE